MCGITGAIVWKGNGPIYTQQTLENMAAPLRFRGPDASGYYLNAYKDTQIAFAHKRLSIIDLSEGGAQPMHSYSQNSTIVFNGEIYNYKSLKQELEAKGRIFNSGSDTAVILEGYEQWGMAKLLEKLDGMFAFALFCRKSNKLFLARDRFGKKPLYYQVLNRHIIFSSDIRSFEATNLPYSINLHALGYYFAELGTPKIDSIWEEIKKLPPAHYIEACSENFALEKYWYMPYDATCNLSQNEIIDQTDTLLKKAIEKRLVADVNVAAQLSGGIDSSLVVALMAGMQDKAISTYSVGFNNNVFNELPCAKQVAEKYKTNHHELIVQPEDIKVSTDLILEYGEPFADSSMIPSYLVSKYISKTEKVVCGGDGGDELFCGYYSYYLVDKLTKVKPFHLFAPVADVAAKVLPRYHTQLLSQLLHLAKEPRHVLLNRNMGFNNQQMKELAPDLLEVQQALDKEHKKLWKEYENSTAPLLKKVLHASLDTRLLNDYLVKVDRASMYASLEMRSPFLDKDLAEFAFTLSPNQLLTPHGNKSILKTLAERYLPYDLIYRKKQGFEIPISAWFKKELRSTFQDIVLGQKQTIIPLNYEYIEQLLQEHTEGKDHTHRLWALFVFHIWANNSK